MNKKTLSVLLILFLILGQSSFTLAATKNPKVDWLIERNLVTGDGGGYRLNDPIKRSEVAAMITRTLDAESTAGLLKPIQGKFKDVRPSHWANGYINYAASSNFVNGYKDKTFKADSYITYGEIIKILVMVDNPDFKPMDTKGGYWLSPYLVEGIEQGILRDVQIEKSNYEARATREKVFEMVYNTSLKILMKDQESYKAIAIENARTGNLDQGQVKFVLMDLGPNSPEAKLRYRMNDEVNLHLPDGFDPENILGMVVDITIDKNDTIVDISMDPSFDYYSGPFVAYDTSIMLNNGDKYYVVDKDAKPRALEKLYGVYYNDKAMKYMDYVIDNDGIDGNTDGAFVAEFAKVTLKDREVYYIDAFTFDDIAPVSRVRYSGNNITIITDETSGLEKIIAIDSAFAYDRGNYISIGKEEIMEDSIAHIYNNKAIVEFKTSFAGEFGGVFLIDGVYYGKIQDELFQIRNAQSKRPVYSLDGSTYSVLYDIEANDLLKNLQGEEVFVLLDLNDHLQLLVVEVKFN